MMMLLVLQQCMKILILPVYVLYFTKIYNKIMHKLKETLFKNMQDFANPSGKLHLLEIGVGPGTNFQFYPPNSCVTCVDYNPNFQNCLLENMAQNTHLHFENFVVASAENLSSVSDNSVDVVVCTLVLCSVNSPRTALKEILRVLKPGGAFYFIDHVAADRSTWMYFWQQVFNPTWGYLTDGCSVLRETWKELENVGFSKLNLQHLMGPLVLNLVRPHIYGYAVK
uniref:Methyltransferase type 11 domain-containing protein n=1 Tax=Naja naja TaxID=35670 RepID=A0A8C6VL00_NAJNA